MKNRDIAILNKILEYIDGMNDTISEYKVDFNVFQNNRTMKNAIAMDIQQIGELANILTDEFTMENDKMPWRSIIAVRNRTAHGYGSIDLEVMWDIVTKNIPELKEYCESIIKEKQQ